jgi:hypothetical protein
VDIHFDSHAVLDVDQQVAPRLAMESFDEGKGCVADTSWVNKGERQQTRWNPNALNGLRAVPAPDFTIRRVIERIEPFGEAPATGTLISVKINLVNSCSITFSGEPRSSLPVLRIRQRPGPEKSSR